MSMHDLDILRFLYHSYSKINLFDAMFVLQIAVKYINKYTRSQFTAIAGDSYSYRDER